MRLATYQGQARLEVIDAADVGRIEACASSLSRGMEMLDFCAAEGLTMPTVGLEIASERGTRLQPILAQIPFTSSVLGMGKPFDLGRKLRDLARQLAVTLKVGDAAFIHNVVGNRNALIHEFVKALGGARKAERIEVDVNPPALAQEFPVAQGDSVRVVCQPNARVTVTAKTGKRHTLLLDYATGYAPDIDDRTNRQITTMAALESYVAPKTQSVAVSLIALNDADPGKLELVTFDAAALAHARGALQLASVRAATLASRYSEKRGEPSPELAKQLDAAARSGEHCKQCAGRICCGRLMRELKLYQDSLSESRSVGAFAEATIRRVSSDPTALDDTMNIQILGRAIEAAQALHKQGETFDKLREEAEDLGRQAILRGKNVPGLGLKSGAQRLKVVEKDTVPADPKTPGSTPREKPRDVTPAAMFERLQPVLLGVSRDDFVNQACNVDPTKTRDLLADVHKIDPKEVFKQVLQPLGPENPFEMKANNPSVVRAEQANVVVVREVVENFMQAAAPAKSTAAPAQPAAAPLPEAKPAAAKRSGAKR